jgi:hypothetical protein
MGIEKEKTGREWIAWIDWMGRSMLKSRTIPTS